MPFFSLCHLQQNEILRENKFFNWSFNKENFVPMLVMVVVFPLVVHTLVKGEYAIRETKSGQPIVERL